MSEDKKPAPDVEGLTWEKVHITGEIVFSNNSLAFEPATDGTGIFTGTVPENVFEREYSNEDVRDRRHIEAGLFLLDVATRGTPLAEEAYNAIVRLSEILVRRGLLPVAYDRAHTIHLSEPISEVTVLKLMEDAGTA